MVCWALLIHTPSICIRPVLRLRRHALLDFLGHCLEGLGDEWSNWPTLDALHFSSGPSEIHPFMDKKNPKRTVEVSKHIKTEVDPWIMMELQSCSKKWTCFFLADFFACWLLKVQHSPTKASCERLALQDTQIGAPNRLLIWLVVGPPLWKIWKSIGMIRNPIYAKIKNGNQTTNQLWLATSTIFRSLAPRGAQGSLASLVVHPQMERLLLVTLWVFNVPRKSPFLFLLGNYLYIYYIILYYIWLFYYIILY